MRRRELLTSVAASAMAVLPTFPESGWAADTERRPLVVRTVPLRLEQHRRSWE